MAVAVRDGMVGILKDLQHVQTELRGIVEKDGFNVYAVEQMLTNMANKLSLKKDKVDNIANPFLAS